MLHSRDGVIWVLNCSQFLPDITLHKTTEKVQFLFNQNFHKSFSANSWGLHATKTMQMSLGTVLCDVTKCPAVGKCRMGNLDSGLCGALFFSAHHNRQILHCGFTKYIYRYMFLYFFTTSFFIPL